MDVIRVDGGARLEGAVDVAGAKNSVLKLMSSALLAVGTTTIANVPDIRDVSIMAELLRRLGCDVRHEQADGAGRIVVDVPQELGTEADYDLVRRLRASICVLGPLLTRCGHVKVALPGGDAIGSRGLDMHVAGLRRMGAELSYEHGFVIASSPRLTGSRIDLEFPSVGATENLVTGAVLARGTTVIDNAAREPEIVDLCAMLTAMGANIGGAGSSTITIDGVDAVAPTNHLTVGDRIVGGTWAYAAAITRGRVHVRGADADHLAVTLDKLVDGGAEVASTVEGFRVSQGERAQAVDVVTLPYPGFPTDLMPMALAAASVADGPSLITENVFDARFMLVNELGRLGAEVRTDGHHAVVQGKEWLSSAPVTASDIRAGAALVLAGLRADGSTDIAQIHHIDRGYPGFVESLRGLGASIKRVQVAEEELLP